MKNNKEVKNEISVQYEIDGNKIKLTPQIVQEYIVGTDAKITLQEFKLFTELCKVRKLNPFLKEAYLIKYSSAPAQIVVGKDAILKRAVLNPKYDGMEAGVIVIDNETGEEKYKNGTFYNKEKETLAGGWARVYIKDVKIPSYASVDFEEVAGRKKDGKLNSNWAGKGATMVEKVAKVRALREAFVEDLAGMYEAEEFAEVEPVKEPIIINQDEPTEETTEVVEAEFVEEESEKINISEL